MLKTLPSSNAMLPEDMLAEPVKFSAPVNRSALAARGTLNTATKPNAKALFVIDSSATLLDCLTHNSTLDHSPGKGKTRY
jgi:hypothetical protein